MEPLGYSEASLLEALRVWWDGEVGGIDDPFAEPRPKSGTLFDVLPAIDSLGVITGLVTIEGHVGFEVPARIIRRGGYDSFQDMVADLLPKVQAMAARHGRTGRTKQAA